MEILDFITKPFEGLLYIIGVLKHILDLNFWFVSWVVQVFAWLRTIARWLAHGIVSILEGIYNIGMFVYNAFAICMRGCIQLSENVWSFFGMLYGNIEYGFISMLSAIQNCPSFLASKMFDVMAMCHNLLTSLQDSVRCGSQMVASFLYHVSYIWPLEVLYWVISCLESLGVSVVTCVNDLAIVFWTYVLFAVNGFAHLAFVVWEDVVVSGADVVANSTRRFCSSAYAAAQSAAEDMVDETEGLLFVAVFTLVFAVPVYFLLVTLAEHPRAGPALERLADSLTLRGRYFCRQWLDKLTSWWTRRPLHRTPTRFVRDSSDSDTDDDAYSLVDHVEYEPVSDDDDDVDEAYDDSFDDDTEEECVTGLPNSRDVDDTVSEISESGAPVYNVLEKLKAERERRLCVVCQSRVKRVFIIPCRHLCLCISCGQQWERAEFIACRTCPLCRTRVRRLEFVYT